ncbi:hypothetical protein [Phenylobacterium aquaticum]|uniref:hypothetical protein n=1 Tax=Phenylobacterium aquaticum TaxID=1763816 RepID=UPI001F5D2604|nr:hypothetical protein [Phenylobacterium aquaticum]MCI3135334.1 hypothetical protein [Phenylobacterium aquaticum]
MSDAPPPPLDPLRTIRGEGLPAETPTPARLQGWMAIGLAVLLALVMVMIVLNRNHRIAGAAAADDARSIAQAKSAKPEDLSPSDAAASALATSNEVDAQAAKAEHEAHDGDARPPQAPPKP